MVLVLMLFMAWGGVAPSSSSARTRATEAWATVLRDVQPTELLTHPDGSISVFNCASTPGRIQAQTLTPSGALRAEVKDILFSPCDSQKTVGHDGTLYGVRTNGTAPPTLAAYRGGVRVWERHFRAPDGLCSNAVLGINAIVIGADGNIHLALRDLTRTCPSQGFIAGITPQNMQVYNAATGSDDIGWFGAFRSGLIIQSGTKDLTYFSYAGSRLASVAMQFEVTEGVNAAAMANDANGNVYAAIGRINSQQEASCREASLTTKLAVYGQRGLHGQVAMFGCMNALSVAAGSWGGAFAGRSNNGTAQWLITLDSSGQKLATVNLPMKVGHQTFAGIAHYPRISGDAKGNVVLLRSSVSEDGRMTHARVEVRNPGSGNTVAVFDSQSFYVDAGFYAQEIGLAEGRIYLLGIKCLPFNCGSGEQYHLFAVDVPHIGIDVPRGSMLGTALPARPVKIDTYFMGDSYISGEGIAPFEPEKDSSQRCHRSRYAWPRLAHMDPAIDIRITTDGFLACSGATIHDMRYGSKGQPSQIAGLSRGNARKIVISIGGNDIEFKKLIYTCLLADCRMRARYTQQLIDALDSRYNQLIKAIRARMGKDVELYFMGYPYVVPLNRCNTAPAWLEVFASYAKNALLGGSPTTLTALKILVKEVDLSWKDVARSILARQLTLSDQEVIALSTIQGKLNNQIRQSVTSRGAHFVSATYPGSPFSGHELCPGSGKEPYFNGLTLRHPEYSFHPHAQGAKAFTEVFGHYLRALG